MSQEDKLNAMQRGNSTRQVHKWDESCCRGQGIHLIWEDLAVCFPRLGRSGETPSIASLLHT